MSRLAAISLLLAPLAACDAAPTPEVRTVGGDTMGTTYRVEVVRPPPALDQASLAGMTAEALALVDGRMSTYREDSELMRFNRSRSTDWFAVSEETSTVVQESLRIAALSEGAFDPTLQPLVRLWGFAGTPAVALPPAREALDRARERVGFGRLAARAAPPALRKDHPDLELDLSGIAKGFAVDVIAERLAAAGAGDFLIEIGGELRAAGHNRSGDAWRVAIEEPVHERGRIHCRIGLRGEAIATSGSYRNFATRGATRFAHILDPETGAPVTGGLVSVSVVAASAMRADALATALFALGPERGLALAEREGLPVLFLLWDEDGLHERSNARFAARRLPDAGEPRKPTW